MKLHLTITFSVMVFLASGATSYAPGDTLYVWAKSGLTLRKSPNQTSAVIRKLQLGEAVVVIEKTDQPFETTLIPGIPHEEPDLNVEPFVCKGYWVHVKTISDESGFMADPYLLTMDPNAMYENKNTDNPMKVVRFDTTWVNPDTAYNASPIYCLRLLHPYGIATEACVASIDDKRTFVFPGVTIEEALIFFSVARDNYAEAQVTNYHHDGLRLSISEMCHWTVSMNDTETRIEEECAF